VSTKINACQCFAAHHRVENGRFLGFFAVKERQFRLQGLPTESSKRCLSTPSPLTYGNTLGQCPCVSVIADC
jgi:hypothetical protein